MKKLLLVLVFLTIPMLMTGCVNSGIDEENARLTNDFTASISAKIGKDSFSAKLERADKDTVVSYTSPSAIDGLTVKKSSEGYEIGFEGLEMSVDNGWFPEKSLLNVLDDVFDTLSGDTDGFTLRKFAGNYIYTGAVDMGSFELVVDSETKDITTLSVASQAIEINFSDYNECTG